MGTTLAADLDIPVLDIWETTDRAERAAQQHEAAASSWIARNPFGYTILHYDDVVAVLRDKRWHSATSRIMEMSGITDPAYLERRRTSILSAEGEEHTRLRRLVGKAFSPRAADRLRPFMREVIDGLVDEVAPRGRSDVAVDICEPYPIPIICELLGAPKEDWKQFSQWATDVLRIFNGNLAVDLPTIVAAQDELDAYTRELIADRRDKPAEDLITDLIAASNEGDKLSDSELVMMVEAVIVGGTDTTRNQLGCAVALFAEYPEQWAELADQPRPRPAGGRGSDALLRRRPWHGALRQRGHRVSRACCSRPARSSPRRWPRRTATHRCSSDPDVFDITRQPSGQPQLTFGSGIHYCLGAALARAELQEALPTAGPPDARPRPRRRGHLEAQRRRHLRPRPPPRHVHPGH